MTLAMLMLLLVLLLWQLRRSRLPWRWRGLWLPVVLAFAAILWPVSWPQVQRQLVLLTPGDAQTEQQALAYTALHDATVMALPTQPSASELARINPYWPAQLHLFGYGLDERAWQQLPAQTVVWQPPSAPAWQLEFAAQLVLGDPLRIRLQVPVAARLVQLLDSRKHVVADAVVAATRADLVFHLAAVGHYDWSLDIRDSSGALLQQLPLAFAVTAPDRAIVAGHFAAPSFEQRALRDWLQQSGMAGEFFSQTGQQLQRRDRFGGEISPASEPTLWLIDLRSWQAATARQREHWLAQVAGGRTLVLLADGSENEQLVRQHLAATFAIKWRFVPEAQRKLIIAEVALTRAGWQVEADDVWQAHSDSDPDYDAVMSRAWQNGSVVWLGVADSHRLWQRAKQAYGQWWQRALQLSSVVRPSWQIPEPGVQQEPMPLCLNNAVSDDRDRMAPRNDTESNDTASASSSEPGAVNTINSVETPPIRLQTPSGVVEQVPTYLSAWPGRACAWYMPSEAGWYRITEPVTASWRVRERQPVSVQSQWLAYQASARHTQPVSPALTQITRPLPKWPFLIIFAVAISLIWWRERQLV